MKGCAKWSAVFRSALAKTIRAFALFLIVFYRSTLSIFFGGICRFEPSCSCYAHEAFSKHPPFHAFRLSLRRLLKCHPFGPYGWDPVPQPKVIQGNKN